jgi:hypothetical protein
VRLLRFAVIVLFASMLLVETGRAVAQSGDNPCRSIGTDDTVRPIPQSLVPVAKRVFGLRMEDQQVRRSTVFRCADGHILLCNYGANLPCGKANADHRLPQAEAWCREHADTDFIPRYVLPIGNIYNWRCAAGTPTIVAQIETIDPRGFVARYWKPAE